MNLEYMLDGPHAGKMRLPGNHFGYVARTEFSTPKQNPHLVLEAIWYVGMTKPASEEDCIKLAVQEMLDRMVEPHAFSARMRSAQGIGPPHVIRKSKDCSAVRRDREILDVFGLNADTPVWDQLVDALWESVP